jgi:hypothetical protein
MDREYWATFSIHDYQTPRFRRSLVLFDKVVIPVPTAPIRTVTEEEITKLSTEVDYLEKEGAAARLEWDPKDFKAWREAHAGEAIAQMIDQDRQLATRLQVQEAVQKNQKGKFSVPGKTIRAIPVYADWREYDELYRESDPMRVFEIVARELSVPAEDASLEEIIRLRARKSFQESMRAMRRWQDDILLDLLKSGNNKEVREAILQKAVNDLEKWMKQYQSTIEDANFKKVKTAVVSLLLLGATLSAGAGPLIASLAALAPPLFDFSDAVRPTWQLATNLECAPAGVLYESAKLLKGK